MSKQTPSMIPFGFLGLFFTIILSQALAGVVPEPNKIPLGIKVVGTGIGLLILYLAFSALGLNQQKSGKKRLWQFILLAGYFTLGFFARLILGF
jgi:hypothetical protein